MYLGCNDEAQYSSFNQTNKDFPNPENRNKMKHLLKFAFGNLKKTVFTSMLNLIGLTSAFATFILIMLYVWNEYHFDDIQKNKNEIYRLETMGPDGGKTSVFMLGPTGQTLNDEFPEVVASTTYMPWGKWGEQAFTYEDQSGGKQYSYEDYAYADENLTSVFTFDFVHSTNTNPLANPETAIVSESFARKAWGAGNATGKTLKVADNLYTVTGIFKDMTENTVFRCPIILKIPSKGWLAEARTGWNVTNYPQFILVKPGTDTKHLNKLMNEQSIIKSKYNFYDNGKTSATLMARPLGDLRFTREVSETPMFEANNKTFVDSLFGVGILILIVAIINFINFSTARIPMRMKSFSISRIIGGSRLEPVCQLFAETLALFLVSFVLAIALAWMANHQLSVAVLGYQLPFFQNKVVLAYALLIAILAAVGATIYPSLVTVSANPAEQIKHPMVQAKGAFRGVLTVFQFAATIALIVASVGIVKQVKYMERADLGFTKSNTLVMPLNTELSQKMETFRDKITANPYIQQVACSRAVPGQAQESNTFNVNGKMCWVWDWAVDDKYMDMMGFEILEGRGFLKDSKAEDGNYICNETAAKAYGWTVGTKIGNGQLVGIMKDFNMVSLRQKVDPFVFWKTSSPKYLLAASIRIQEGHQADALAAIQKAYSELGLDVPFRAYFLDDHLNLLYTKENQQAKLITFFSLLSIIVSVLGILGLSIFLCQQKVKEIGIRKVNGARVTEIIAMLNRDFVKWVLIAFVLATPLSYYVMSKWLSGFAYKTSLSWWIFVLAGLLALGIALLTVSFQSWKAATKNPVESLRYE
jgi:putative ABC transport system permease protein